MSRADVCAATLAGGIAGAAWHGSLGALASTPMWLMAACAALLGAGAGRGIVTGGAAVAGSSAGRVAASLLSGIAIGWALPAGLPAPGGAVFTHWRSLPLAAPRASDLFDALDLLDRQPDALIGRRVAVTGRWHPAQAGVLAAVSQTVMACCAADAIEVGFDVIAARPVRLKPGTFVRVGGVVSQTLRDGEVRFALTGASVRMTQQSF